jgi:glycosyltransferase involved in cell wall biosynthesis
MGKAQALSAVLDAAKLLETRAPKVSFIFLGGGVELETLKRRVERDQSANVVFIPAVPMHDVGAYLQSADALLVHLKKDPLFEITIPSKTQAYMAIGKPILMAVGGDAAELVLRAGGGVVAESENAASIADAAAALAEADITERKAMGDRGRKFYFENLALDIGARSFESLFLRLSASRR